VASTCPPACPIGGTHRGQSRFSHGQRVSRPAGQLIRRWRPSQRHRVSKLIVQLVKVGLASEGMRVEMRVASPKPAVGVFTPAGNLSRAPFGVTE